jgi:NodT family efflux transporter outer membrane factor (OMF) lipoprotein
VGRLRRRRATPALVAFAGLLSACAVGPSFRPPAPPAADRYTPAPLGQTADGQHFVVGGAVMARWWTLYGSPKLDALEDEALKANSDLAAAEAALRQARELYLAQRASLWPTVALAASATRAKNAATIAPPLANNSEEYTLFQGQLNLTYTLDVFGGLHRQVESAAAQADNQRYETEAAYLTLTTNVANAALQIAGLDDQLRAASDAVAVDRRTLALTRSQQRLGQASTADVAAAEAALEQAEQQTPPLRKAIDVQRDLLAVLIGRPSEAAPTDALALADFRLPRELPVSLPADLVRQRPDVLAAEANLHAASAQVGVAIAARLPTFTLDGSAGGASSRLLTLLSNGNTLWSVGGDVAQTVFDAGALKHRQRAAEAALEQSKAQYRSTVLGALQNVADVLQSIVEDASAEDHAAAAAGASSRSLKLAEGQFKAGETGVLPVLTAQASLAQVDVALAQAHAARLADGAALFQALGGGWWNDPLRQADAAR